MFYAGFKVGLGAGSGSIQPAVRQGSKAHSAPCIGPPQTVGRLGLLGGSVSQADHGSWELDFA